MGFLNPLLLLTGAAISVPIVLHLFHRHDRRRVSFPAIRYLLRTEKEHARTIRFRQILLLLLRITAILCLVLAAARPFLRGGGGVHEPTALAIVLDNSMSSGLVEGDRRILDRLKGVALESLARAGEEDRIWVIRAGEPWDVASPGGRDDVRARIEETEVSAARADIGLQVQRAEALLAASTFEAREIHIISDLQASGFQTGRPTPASVPIVVFDGHGQDTSNRALSNLLIGGGLPPLANQQTGISVLISSDSDTVQAPIRLIAGGRIRAAGAGIHDTEVALPFGPFPSGRVAGYVETDPDRLRWDDRQYFVAEVAPAPSVRTAGPVPFFLDQALSVLQDADRITRGSTSTSDVLWSVGGVGLGSGQPLPSVIIPPSDPALVPALNRSLARAGIPWRYGAATSGGGESRLQETTGPVDLEDVRVYRSYRMSGASDPAEGSIFLDSGEPWLVRGQSAGVPYILLASPLEVESTNLPLTASMMSFVEWLSAQDISSPGRRGVRIAGEPLPPTARESTVRDPEGGLHTVDASSRFVGTRLAGHYQVLVDDSVATVFAVNPPPSESDGRTLSTDEVRSLFGDSDLRVISDSTRWSRSVFVAGQGPELWRGFLILAVILLVAESMVAAAGSEAGERRVDRGRAGDDASVHPV